MTDAPIHLRVHLMHALLQKVADDNGIDILHVKGPAVHPALLQQGQDGPLPRESTDADVLVRPKDAKRFLGLLRELGLEQRSRFKTGSPFEHAATVWSDTLGYSDVHRFFPGIGVRPAVAFQMLWRHRDAMQIGGWECTVPAEEDQRLILLLHAARSGNPQHRDKVRCWDEADAITRAGVRARAAELDANVALAAAIGELSRYKGHRTYRLWEQFSRSEGHSRTDEWVARLSAARTPWHAASLLVRAFRVNTDRMALDLGRQPTKDEIRAASRDRFRRALTERRARRKADQ